MLRVQERFHLLPWAVAVAVTVAPEAVAQKLPQVEATPPPTSTEPSRASDLIPSALERFASGLSLSWAVTDVPDSRFNEDGDEVPIDNRRLWQGTLTFKASSLFLTPADLSRAFKKLPDYAGAFGLGAPTDPLAGRTFYELVDYFQRTRRSDRWGRFLSTLTVSASQAERSDADFGFLTPANRHDGRKWTFDFTIDPATLFLTPKEKAEAYEALTAYLTWSDANTTGYPDLTRYVKGPISTREVVGLSRSQAVLATLVPKVVYRSVDEFDYAMVGGQPIEFSPGNRDKAIESLTLTWDLLKIIKPTAARLDAVDAIEKLRALASTVEERRHALAIDEKPIRWIHGGFAVRKAVMTRPDVEVTWKDAHQATTLARGLYLGTDGILLGAPQCPGGPPCEITIDSEAKTASGRKFNGLIIISVVER